MVRKAGLGTEPGTHQVLFLVRLSTPTWRLLMVSAYETVPLPR